MQRLLHSPNYFNRLLKFVTQKTNPHYHLCTLHSKEGAYSWGNYDEVTFKVPWGHIAGKWYGPKDIRPIVCLHGWQDNAGSFDTLIPLLPARISFLSLDFPGHGHSSWLPPGITYHSIDYVVLLRRLMEELNWDKISILGHSMNSINAFVFSSLFPNKVDLLIGLDVLKPLNRSPTKIVDSYTERLELAIKYERRMKNPSEPPCYEWSELVERLHMGTQRSVSRNSCKYLLERNIKPSQFHAKKYYFARDGRLKTSLFYTFPNEVPLEMAGRIRCPHLFVKASDGPYYEKKEYYDECIKKLSNNVLFEHYTVEGTHHVHLNDPDKVAPIISQFINKYR